MAMDVFIEPTGDPPLSRREQRELAARVEVREGREWDFSKSARWRELLSNLNDGITSSAAIIQGLLSGGATGQEALIGALAVITIGMVGSAGAEYSDSEAERSAILAAVREEQRQLELSPEAEIDELAQLYEKRGFSPELAREVAEQLSAHDPLQAQLSEEYDIDEIPSGAWPWKRGAAAAIAFLVGSIMPLFFLVVLPWDVRGEVTAAAVMASLALSGWLGHWVEGSTWWRSMLRTMVVGVVTLGISALAGSLVTF